MKKWLLLGLLLLPLWSCVGHKDDLDPDAPAVVDPDDGSTNHGTRFFRRSLVMDFTGTWCQYCPNMAQALEVARASRPGRIVEVAVYCNDQLSAAESDDLVRMFKVSAYPTVVFNYDISTAFSTQTVDKIESRVDKAGTGAACGIGWEWKNGTLKVKVKAAESGTYSVMAALVDDSIVAPQTGASPAYRHYAVLKGYLTGMEGKSLGKLSAKEEKTVDISGLPASYVEGQRVVVWVLQDTGGTMVAVNAAQGKWTEKLGYRYEED